MAINVFVVGNDNIVAVMLVMYYVALVMFGGVGVGVGVSVVVVGVVLVD